MKAFRKEGGGSALNVQASIGLRYFIARNWTLDVEATFQHISNAYFDERNESTNAVGGLLGVTYFFGGLSH